MADPTITDLVSMEDVALTNALVINRPINLNLNGHEIKGDLQYEFEDEAELILGPRTTRRLFWAYSCQLSPATLRMSTVPETLM